MSFLTNSTLAWALLAPIAAMAQAHSGHGAQPAATPAPGRMAEAASAPARDADAGSYRSVFDGFRRYGEQPVMSWREANDVVGRIGGWQAYAREGQRGPVAGSAPPAATSPGPSPAPVKAAPPPKGSSAPATPASGPHSGGHSGHQ